MKNRKSFNSVRFEKGSGKNYVVKSVLSKGNADFFVEVYKMTILETKNLKKYYGKGDTQVKALDGVNLSVEDGEFVAIVGTSGSGKSTLLHMLGGLDRPTSGSVTVDGKNIFSLKDEALTIFRRRKIGFVFQSFNLVPVLTVRENKLAAEVAAMETDEEKEAEAEEKKESGKAFGELAPDVRRSLWLILFSVAFWFMGYNAVTSAFTRYMQVQWGYDIKAASLCLMVATVGAVLSYLPVGILSSKFGRKKLIQAGVILLAVCFATAGLFTAFHPAVYVVFALVGVAWAMINVNSYPMVVEISKSGDVGKYTGYYYTFSMAAQIITPILSGLLLEHVGYQTLMPYATVMVAISFVTISLARHGDNKPEPPKSKLEAFDVGDD